MKRRGATSARDGAPRISTSNLHVPAPTFPLDVKCTVANIRIRVTGPHDDDEDWVVGESLDGSRSGGFPKVRRRS